MAADNQHQIIFKDFSAGWIPSDDAINGRRTGLLKMDGVTLDDNGSLILQQGTKKDQGPYAANAHSLFYKLMCGERRAYLGLEDGSVWRNSTNLVAAGAGSTDRIAFGVYGPYVLIFSGAQRLKDSCDDGILDLGLTPPDIAPIINPFSVTPILGNPAGTGGIAGTFASFAQMYGTVAGTATELDISTTNIGQNYRSAAAVNGTKQGYTSIDLHGTEDDTFTFKLKVDDVSKLSNVPITGATTGVISLIFLLKPAQTALDDLGPSYVVQFSQGDLLAQGLVDNQWTTISCKRSDFVRSNVDKDRPYGWQQVTGCVIFCASDSFGAAANFAFKDFILYPNVTPTDQDVLGPLNGTYEWVQVNVFNNGSYTAMSKPSPITDDVDLANGYVEVIPIDPTITEPQANEVWIYRRGGTLQFFYRVLRILMDDLGDRIDNMSDVDALALGEVLNTNLLSSNSTDLPEDIIDMVGPIFGRMVYFSSTQIYFSAINNPDAYDPRNTMKLASDDTETFQWARKVSENIIMIGTLKDVYIITGTFTSFPDGALDVYLRNLGVNKPPISRFATVYNGSVIYFASQEWIILSPTGQYQSLVSPNTDVLYTGQTRYGYGGVPSYLDTPDISYSCVVAKNKLWVVVPTITDYVTPPGAISTWTYRMEVFDFGRKYWRPVPFSPFLLAIADDEALYGFFNENKSSMYMDDPFTKLLNIT